MPHDTKTFFPVLFLLFVHFHYRRIVRVFFLQWPPFIRNKLGSLLRGQICDFFSAVALKKCFGIRINKRSRVIGAERFQRRKNFFFIQITWNSVSKTKENIITNLLFEIFLFIDKYFIYVSAGLAIAINAISFFYIFLLNNLFSGSSIQKILKHRHDWFEKKTHKSKASEHVALPKPFAALILFARIRTTRR